jgi:hypothetical protein
MMLVAELDDVSYDLEVDQPEPPLGHRRVHL